MQAFNSPTAQPRINCFSVLRVLTIALICICVGWPAQAKSSPRLAVLVVFDQLRHGDLLRLRPAFQSGGFGGFAHTNSAIHEALYNYGNPETGPGHATIATGANPTAHGICNNRWFVDGQIQYSVDDPNAPVLGGAEGVGRSAHHLMLPTLGDTLKLHTNGAGKVISISGKDRAAILSAGKTADLALWYDKKQRRFTSSEAYVQKLPNWAEELGQHLTVEDMKSGEWSPLPVSGKADNLIPTDARQGESEPHGFSQTFPHHLKDLGTIEQKQRLFMGTPQGMDSLFQLAKAAVANENLGQDGHTDLLVVSVSSTDLVGHWFGPGSLEMFDILRRADMQIRDFHDHLKRQVGEKNLIFAVTSDHGAAPLPEHVASLKVSSGRIPVAPIRSHLATLAQKETGGRAQIAFHPPHLYVTWKEASSSDRIRLLDEIQNYLEKTPGIAGTYRKDKPTPSADPYGDLMHRSLCANRSGDLMIRTEPFWLFSWGKNKGTDHGTPYHYDRSVPFIVSSPGIARGTYPQPIDVRDIAPTMSALMEMAAPAGAQGRPAESVKSTDRSLLP